MATTEEIINTIRDNQATDYAERVPSYNKENLVQVGNAITSNKNITNSFMSALINKVGESNIKSKIFQSKIAPLKKGNTKPFGYTIEELFINPATDMGYQSDPTYLLKNTTADGKVAYYGLNRKSEYACTRSKMDLMQAFTSETAFANFYDGIVNSLYSGDNIDEYLLCKYMFAKNIDEGHILKIESDINNPKTLAESITNVAKYMTEPTRVFAPYNYINKDKITAGEKKVITFTQVPDIVLIVRHDVMTKLNYEVLATYFQLPLVQLKMQTIEIDTFPTDSNFDCYAMLIDNSGCQIRDTLIEADSQYIASNLRINNWLHHWQYQYLSCFANVCCFGKTTNKAGSSRNTEGKTLTMDELAKETSKDQYEIQKDRIKKITNTSK